MWAAAARQHTPVTRARISQEYDQLKEQARAETASDLSELEALQRHQTAEQQQLDGLKQQQSEFMNKHESNGKMLQKYQDRQQSVKFVAAADIARPRIIAVDPRPLRSDR